MQWLQRAWGAGAFRWGALSGLGRRQESGRGVRRGVPLSLGVTTDGWVDCDPQGVGWDGLGARLLTHIIC